MKGLPVNSSVVRAASSYQLECIACEADGGSESRSHAAEAVYLRRHHGRCRRRIY
ncbi:MAG: hypothetical protein MZV63_47135 [Marinilabiliales bacterium]|nr:hypothetical protein [Marinilabiliales bacterium]